MNTNLQVLNQTLTMTSREIAELTGKQHKHVLTDIRNMLNSLGLAAADFSATALIDGPNGSKRSIEIFNLPKRETLILVSGYNIQMRSIIIDRWQELESKNTTAVSISQLTQHEIAVKQLEGEYKVWNLFECPIHIAQQEIVKLVRKDTGVDFSEALKHAKAQQNILPQDVMLEPTEIGIRLGLGSGKVVNQLLESYGFQTRINGEWVPTILGEPHCQKHAWVNTNKSGYNLKWSLNFIENNINSDED